MLAVSEHRHRQLVPYQPCSPGAERQGCGEPRRGIVYSVRGTYKAKGVTDGTYLDRCLTCSACPQGSACSDLDPCVLLTGGSTTDTASCTCPSGRYQDSSTAQWLAYPNKPEDDMCFACQLCPPGGDRDQCGLSSAGVVPWSVPVVESVSGSGRTVEQRQEGNL